MCRYAIFKICKIKTNHFFSLFCVTKQISLRNADITTIKKRQNIMNRLTFVIIAVAMLVACGSSRKTEPTVAKAAYT